MAFLYAGSRGSSGFAGSRGSANGASGGIRNASAAAADGGWHSFGHSGLNARYSLPTAGRTANSVAGSGRSASSFASTRMAGGGLGRSFNNSRFAQGASLAPGSTFGRSFGGSSFAGRAFNGFGGRGFGGFGARGFGGFGFRGLGFGSRFGCWSCGWGWGWNWGLGFGWGWGWGIGWPYAWDYWDPYWYNPFWSWTSYGPNHGGTYDNVPNYDNGAPFGNGAYASPDDSAPSAGPETYSPYASPQAPANVGPMNRNDIFQSPLTPGNVTKPATVPAPVPAPQQPAPQLRTNSRPSLET